MLFQSVSKAGNFDDLKIYYFHNCLDSYLYRTPDLNRTDMISTEQVINNLNETYKVIIVGDAEMAYDELVDASWEMYGKAREKSCLERFMDIKRKYAHIIWLHPQDEPFMETYWSKSFFELKKHFPMYKQDQTDLPSDKELL